MLIKSNKKMIKFFDPNKIPIEKIVNYKTHDQTYLNKNLAKFKYEILQTFSKRTIFLSEL